MPRLCWSFALVVFAAALGCSKPAPAPPAMTPELQAQIKAHDAAVDEAEKAQSKK